MRKTCPHGHGDQAKKEPPMNPQRKDGDEDPPDEPVIEVELPDEPAREFYWTDDPDEIRRFYILCHMSDADVEAKILVENMSVIFNWCVKGELPKKAEKPKSVLKLHDKTD
jgi:hypothetical protein